MNEHSFMVEKFVDAWLRDQSELDGQRNHNVARLQTELGKKVGGVWLAAIQECDIAFNLIKEVNSVFELIREAGPVEAGTING